MPPPLPRGGLGIPQSFAFSPEAPLLGELSAKQTERLDEGQPDREAFAKLNLSVIAYAMPPPLPRGGLGIPQSFASSPEAPLLRNEVRLRGCTKDSLTGKLLLNSTSPSRLTPCHLPYRGEALAFRKALPLRQRLPYQGSCLRSRLRGCTKDSLTGKLLLNSTSPSRLRRATSPTEGRLWHSAKPCLLARGSPTKERSETERLDEGQPDRKPLTFGHSETGDAVCLYIICPMTAA